MAAIYLGKTSFIVLLLDMKEFTMCALYVGNPSGNIVTIGNMREITLDRKQINVISVERVLFNITLKQQ